LIEAFALVTQAQPQARLLLGGEGDRARYARQATELRVFDKVTFLGWVAGEAKQRLLQSAAVFVLPSRFEGLPVSMLEAMSLAVPCVATPVGGVPDIVTDGVNGCLVPVDQPAPLAAALVRLLADPDYRAGLGRAARETVVTRFSASAVEAQLAQLYAKARRA
jgi:glycosyltransferase involved in cell wall biosynthesis